jgi:hypothetical protein
LTDHTNASVVVSMRCFLKLWRPHAFESGGYRRRSATGSGCGEVLHKKAVQGLFGGRAAHQLDARADRADGELGLAGEIAPGTTLLRNVIRLAQLGGYCASANAPPLGNTVM